MGRAESEQQEAAVPDVILHAFDWPFSEIEAHARGIADCGYGAVLFPPPLSSDEQGGPWWRRYQPKDYRVVRSALGRKRDLEQAIAALHGAGVRAYADVVFGHMANEAHLRADPFEFPGAAALERYRRERAEFERDRLYGDLGVGLFSPWDFVAGGLVDDRGAAAGPEQARGCLPALDLNHWVVDQQRQCLRALNALGFDGYRVDAGTRRPGWCEEHLRRVFMTGDMAGKLVVGETLACAGRDGSASRWPLLASLPFMGYDFALHETMRRAFAPSGSLRELVDPEARGQALPWDRALTFTVTHDIPNSEGLRGLLLDPADEALAYAYILGRDGGVPMVYSDHGESAEAHAGDLGRWSHAWRRDDLVQMIRFHNAVHGSRQQVLVEHEGYLVLARGDSGIVAINKTSSSQALSVAAAGLRHGRYRCLLRRRETWITGDRLTLDLPPRQAQLWLHVDAGAGR